MDGFEEERKIMDAKYRETSKLLQQVSLDSDPVRRPVPSMRLECWPHHRDETIAVDSN